jgi:pimeloyl-ACP methyl ester carboxylesterase
MEIIENLKLVPVQYFLVVGFILILALGLVYGLKRGRKKSGGQEMPQSSSKLVKALRLTGFGIFSLVLVVVALMFFTSYQSTISDSTPAPSEVEIPEDLPFDVEEVTFMSEDGLRMAGWFVPPKNGATLILLHGYSANRLQMRWHAEVLTAAGYGILMYDERASGESEGEYRSYGWEDPADVGGALLFLNNRQGVDPAKIGIAGCSIGGQIALQSAAAYPEIGAVWADGPSSVRASDIPPVDNLLLWLIKTSNFVLDWTYQQVLDIEAPQPLIETIGTIAPRPIMLVGGGIEVPVTGNEAWIMEHYASYAGNNAKVWIIEEAYHCDGPLRRPDEYAARMIGFFDQAFGIPSNP